MHHHGPTRFTDDEVACFHDSLQRCSTNPRFMEHFYETFLASSPEVREKFQHTNLPQQHRMLKASLYMIMQASTGDSEGNAHLAHIAASHSQSQHNIPPHLYEVWLRCLLDSVQHCDPHYAPAVEAIWTRMLQHGIEDMKAGYATPPPFSTPVVIPPPVPQRDDMPHHP